MRPCVIIDDEKLAREKIELYLENIEGLELVASYPTAELFLSERSKHDRALIFLDINLPGLTGLELAAMVTPRQQFIFTTAYPEFALNGFELEAADYLVKPFDFRRFLKAVQRAQKLFEKSDIVLIKEGKRIHRLSLSNVYFIQGMKEYVVWQSGKGKIIELNSLKTLEKQLRRNGFVQVHKSFIVNLSKVEYFEANSMSINGTRIPIGRKFKGVVNDFLESQSP